MAKSNLKRFCSGLLALTLVFVNLGADLRIDSAYAVISDGASAVNVLGQGDASGDPIYTDGSPNGTNPVGFDYPTDVVVDPTDHRLFVADRGNDRVSGFNLNVSNELVDYDADYVLGQADLYDGSTVSSAAQNNLKIPRALAFDDDNDRLFVGTQHTGSNRILVFDVSTIVNNENAVYVLGQDDFTSASSGTTAARFNGVFGLEYDSAGERLFVADAFSNRVLVFDVAVITNGENAVNVLGQSDFVTNTANVTQSGLDTPEGLVFDSSSDLLYVSDYDNNRVMVFDADDSDIYAVSDLQHAYSGGSTYDDSYGAHGIDSGFNILHDSLGAEGTDLVEVTADQQDITSIIDGGGSQQTWNAAFVNFDSGTAYTTYYFDDAKFADAATLETYLITLYPTL